MLIPRGHGLNKIRGGWEKRGGKKREGGKRGIEEEERRRQE